MEAYLDIYLLSHTRKGELLKRVAQRARFSAFQ